jgi:hypothetical protein
MILARSICSSSELENVERENCHCVILGQFSQNSYIFLTGQYKKGTASA